MSYAFTALVFYSIPILALLFLVISGALYFHAKWQNKHRPGTYTDRQIKTRLIVFTIASVIAGALLLVVIALAALLFMAVAFM